MRCGRATSTWWPAAPRRAPCSSRSARCCRTSRWPSLILAPVTSVLSQPILDNSPAGASRLAALLVAYILPVCALLSPCHPGAALRDLCNDSLLRDTGDGERNVRSARFRRAIRSGSPTAGRQDDELTSAGLVDRRRRAPRGWQRRLPQQLAGRLVECSVRSCLANGAGFLGIG